MDKEQQAARANAFRMLHDGPDILLLANAWDVASARMLVEAGAPAIATSSAGIAFSLGYPDGQHISREEMLTVVGRIANAVDVPVSADLEAGYGEKAKDVAETVRRAIEVGVIGANIEDGTQRSGNPLFEIPEAVERIRAAREAADELGIPFVINARTDGYLRSGASQQTFDESVRRANAYRAASADSLFIPGVRDKETISRLVARIKGPVNILAGPDTAPLKELRAIGVRRVSVGSGLMRATLGLVRRAAGELRTSGTYAFLQDAPGVGELNRLFAVA